MISKILSLFSKKKNQLKVDDVRLDFAFECGGVKYYEPTDLNLFPWQRMLAATQAYTKMSIGLKTEEEIRKSCQMIKQITGGEKLLAKQIIDLYRIQDVIITRLDSQFRPEELMWNCAAVIFMDQTESPYVYDPVYGQKKIEFWKKHKDATLFFSQLSLRRLIPFLPATDENSRIFTETVKELAKIEEQLTPQKSSNQWQQQKEALKNLRSTSSAKTTARNSSN